MYPSSQRGKKPLPTRRKERNPLQDRQKKIARFLGILALAAILGIAVARLVARIRYEAAGPYTWDTTIYWAVGRGILNGLVPWQDLWETKPPGIFLISALSFLLTGDPRLCHLVQVVAILFIAVTPALALVAQKGVRHFRDPGNLFPVWLSLVSGILYSLYAAERSGEVQVESIGAAALCAYIVVLARGRGGMGSVAISSFAILFSCGLKEPFLLTAFAVAITFHPSAKSLLQRFAVPAGIALLVGLAALVAAGWFPAFFGEYLPFMLQHRVQAGSSAWVRGLSANVLVSDMEGFSPLLGVITALGFLGHLVFRLRKSSGGMGRLLVVAASAAASVYLPSLAVGLGGEYYNHHFVFALPVYLAWLVCALSDSPGFRFGTARATATVAGIAGLVAVPLVGMPDMRYDVRLAQLVREEAIARSEAEYVDAVLDASGQSRYLFLGANGPQLYGWTRHSPEGPMFFQFPSWFGENLPKHDERLLRSLDRSNLVVFDRFAAGPVGAILLRRLVRDFSEVPWSSVRGIVRKTYRYRILFRNDPDAAAR